MLFLTGWKPVLPQKLSLHDDSFFMSKISLCKIYTLKFGSKILIINLCVIITL
ncbi:hypothetical protein LV89_02290 [Arcicella aurantiaca]|uniref:Uncharacterized protein n=1 Tax=Arcicella aurantiaca TaxID=591202 RepID=A0A316E7U2_9BACT|nr:hypothetical protein LV89_02290 [Arcicella aurantiaca]